MGPQAGIVRRVTEVAVAALLYLCHPEVVDADLAGMISVWCAHIAKMRNGIDDRADRVAFRAVGRHLHRAAP